MGLSLQSCLTLSDSMDCSLSGSSIHGIFQARTLEWDAISFSNAMNTPVFWPGELHGQRSLAGYSPWGSKESDMTEWLILIW